MSEIQDMAVVIQLGSKGMYYLIKGEIKAALALMQLLQKLTKSGRFAVGEMESLEKLMKASEGQIQLLSIPTEDPVKIAQLKKDLNHLGLKFTVMPDLNVGDGQMHIAVAQKDMPLASQWYQSFCVDTLMAGGKQEYEQLMSLTQGQVDIVSIPIDDKDTKKLEQLYQDFDKLHINYCKMPDLNVGDGKIQVTYAQADAPKVREWYSQYQADILKETGEMLPELRPVTMEDYTDTAKSTVQSYWDTATPETKQEINQSIQEGPLPGFRVPSKEQERLKQTAEYQAALKQPGAVDITINEKLVINQEMGIIRMPYTKEYIVIPPTSLYAGADKGKTYAAILNKDKAYQRVTVSGQKIGKITGKEIYQHFDKVQRDMSKKVKIKSSEMVKNTIPVPKL